MVLVIPPDRTHAQPVERGGGGRGVSAGWSRSGVASRRAATGLTGALLRFDAAVDILEADDVVLVKDAEGDLQDSRWLFAYA